MKNLWVRKSSKSISEGVRSSRAFDGEEDFLRGSRFFCMAREECCLGGGGGGLSELDVSDVNLEAAWSAAADSSLSDSVT